MQLIEIINCEKQLNVYEAMIADSKISMSCINNLEMNDVKAIGMRIINANLSDLEIEGAQLGGAYIHNIGMPPAGHPYHDPDAQQRPLKFADCNFEGSTITNCNLSKVAIAGSNVTGMTINGILVDDLLAAYKA